MFQNLHISAIFITTLIFFSSLASAQVLTDSLPDFEKIQVSPMINLMLSRGESEHIRIEYEGISPEKINYSVRGKELRIYLDDAKYTVKTEEVIEDGYIQKVPVYRGAEVTAYVSFKNLKSLQVRGEESVICEDSLMSRKFRIKLYGESRVSLAFVQAERLKIYAFGENELTIRAGEAKVQKLRLFGQNKIDTRDMSVEKIKTSSFGESKLAIAANEKIRLWGFGEVEMKYAGDPIFRKLLIGTLSATKW